MSLPRFATSPQRNCILQLLRQAEFDTGRLSLMHTRIPHVERQHVDSNVHIWLSGISMAQASAVIAWLKEEIA